MSMDDPGWGSDIPEPGPKRPERKPSRSRSGAGGQPPVWKRRPVQIGALVVVAGVVVALVVAFSGTTHNVVTVEGAFTDKGYAQAADAICTQSRASITAGKRHAEATGNANQLAAALSKETDQVEALKAPTDIEPQVAELIKSARQAIDQLKVGNTDAAQTAITNADTDAGLLGMKVCNHGH